MGLKTSLKQKKHQHSLLNRDQMKTLIVPTNFSASSVDAVKYAADMALAIHADLHLLHVMQLPVSNAEVPMTENIYYEIKQSGEKELKKLKADLEKQTNGKINIFTTHEIGSVEHQLEELCKRQKPFAVIMGIKKSSIERLVFGSNTLFATQHLHYPLIVIPEGTIYHAIRKIVLACDLTESNESIPVEYLKELKNIFHAALDVLSVNTKKIEQLKSSNEFASLSILLHDLYPTYYFNIANTVEDGINNFIEETNADLLLLLPKRHGFFEFRKSHTKKMILNADMPIMAIHE
jgi:nucleotide-binding universal stress UspA family protein